MPQKRNNSVEDEETEFDFTENQSQQLEAFKKPSNKRKSLASPAKSDGTPYEEDDVVPLIETPQQNSRKYRKSMSGTRRLSSNLQTPGSGRSSLVNPSISPNLFEEENDDDQEKQQNKKNREKERRKSLYKGKFVSVDTSNRRLLNPEQMQEMIKTSMSLFAENKITIKNTWNMQLIDYIDQVLSSALGEQNNFQAASCTLDAGVKIYSLRVDSVHDAAMKVRSSLFRADDKKREENSAEEASQQEIERIDQDAPRKKRTKIGVNTLETNINNLNLKKFEFEYCIEPLYYTNSLETNVDVNSAQALLLNNLNISENLDLILDASKASFDCKMKWNMPQVEEDSTVSASSEETTDNTNEVDAMELIETAVQQQFVNSVDSQSTVVTLPQELADSIPTQIADPVNENGGFAFDNLDVGGEIGGFDLGPVDEDEDEGLFDTDFSAHENPVEPQEIGTEIQVQKESSQSTSSEPALYNSEQNAEERVPSLAQAPMDIAIKHININNDYAYFEYSKNINWTGSNNWKFKSKLVLKDKESKGKTSKPKVAFELDFTKANTKQIDAEFLEQSEKETSNVLSKKTIEALDKKNYLLPEDLHYKLHFLQNLFHIKSIKLVPKSAQGSSLPSATVEYVSKFEASGNKAPKPILDDTPDVPSSEVFGAIDSISHDENDDDDDMPQTDFGGFDAPADEHQLVTETTAAEPAVEELGEIRQEEIQIDTDTLQNTSTQNMNLIEAPRRVEQMKIQYATRDKKIDVKALKETLWTQIKSVQAKENQQQQNNKQKAKTFSELVSTVRDPSNIATAKQIANNPSDISIPFCFICVLHLCNENNLELSGREDFSDFSVLMQ